MIRILVLLMIFLLFEPDFYRFTAQMSSVGKDVTSGTGCDLWSGVCGGQTGLGSIFVSTNLCLLVGLLVINFEGILI